MYTTFLLYYSSSEFSKFIESKWSAHFFVTHIQTEKISSWNGLTVRVCCFMLARASTKTFLSRIQKTAKKTSSAEKFVSRVTCQPRCHCIQGVRKRLYLFQKFCCLVGSILKILCPRERRVFQSKVGVSSSNQCNLHHSPHTGHLGK